MPAADFDLSPVAEEAPGVVPVLPRAARADDPPLAGRDHAGGSDPPGGGGLAPQPPPVRQAQLGVGLQPGSSSSAAGGDDTAAGCRQPRDAGRVRAGGDASRPGIGVGVDQRQSHAALGQFAVPSASAGQRRSAADDDAATADGRPARALPRHTWTPSAKRASGISARVGVSSRWRASLSSHPGELRAFIAEVASPAELVADLVEELGGGSRPH